MCSASPTANRPTATITMSMPLPSWSTPNVSRDWPVSCVDADAADEEPEGQRRAAADHRAADERRDRREGEQREREVVLRRGTGRRGRPSAGRRGSARRCRWCRPRTSRSRPWPAPRAARPRFAIWKPSIAVATDARLARRVEQDRRGRPAVHAARVDAGEQDEGADGIAEVERQRQQQRDRQRRADAGSTPTSVPSVTPSAASSRFCGVSTAPKPSTRLAASHEHLRPPAGPTGRRHAEPARERVRDDRRRAARPTTTSRRRCRLPSTRASR